MPAFNVPMSFRHSAPIFASRSARSAGDARRSGMRAEQLLVLIKDVWSAMHSAFASVPSVHGDERLNYVISTCVDEYYSAHVAPPSEATIAGDYEASP